MNKIEKMIEEIVSDYFQRSGDYDDEDQTYDFEDESLFQIFLFSVIQYMKQCYSTEKEPVYHTGRYKKMSERTTFWDAPIYKEQWGIFKEMSQPWIDRQHERWGYGCYTVSKTVAFLMARLDLEQLTGDQSGVIIFPSLHRWWDLYPLFTMLNDGLWLHDCRDYAFFEYFSYGYSREAVVKKYLESCEGDRTDSGYDTHFETFYQIKYPQAERLVRGFSKKMLNINYSVYPRESGISIVERPQKEKSEEAISVLLDLFKGDFIFYTNTIDLDEPFEEMISYFGDDDHGEVFTHLNVRLIAVSDRYLVVMGETVITSHE